MLMLDSSALAQLVESAVWSALEKYLAAHPVSQGEQIPTDKLALPADEAAATCSMSPRLLWDMTAPRGPIRSVKAGSRVLYPVSELRRWLDAE
jgi:hypothetical protein